MVIQIRTKTAILIAILLLGLTLVSITAEAQTKHKRQTASQILATDEDRLIPGLTTSLTAGRYLVTAGGSTQIVGANVLTFKLYVDGSPLSQTFNYTGNAEDEDTGYTVAWDINITSTVVVQLRARAGFDSPTVRNNGWIIYEKVEAASGSGGAGQSAGLEYRYLTSTTNTDPGTGNLKFNHGTLSSATQLRISETDNNSNAVAAYLATFDDSNSTIRGFITIVGDGNESKLLVYHVNGTLTDNGAWDSIGITNVIASGTFTNNTPVRVLFSRTGDRGNTGPQGSQGIQGPPGNGSGNMTLDLIEFGNLWAPIVAFILLIIWAEIRREWPLYLIAILGGSIAVIAIWNEIESLRVILVTSMAILGLLCFLEIQNSRIRVQLEEEGN